MSRKDYKILAEAFAKVHPDRPGVPLRRSLVELSCWMSCVQAVADALEKDNPRFHRGRFLAAAGVGE